MENMDRFKKVTELTDKQYRVLESIRFRDDDQSVKSGAVLAFSGLMIATSIVQLSTSPDSVIHVGSEALFLLVLNILGLLLLFFSAIVTIVALTSTGKYSIDQNQALIEFDKYVISKSKKVRIASVLTFVGTPFVLIALLVQLVKRMFS